MKTYYKGILSFIVYLLLILLNVAISFCGLFDNAEFIKATHLHVVHTKTAEKINENE